MIVTNLILYWLVQRKLNANDGLNVFHLVFGKTAQSIHVSNSQLSFLFAISPFSRSIPIHWLWQQKYKPNIDGNDDYDVFFVQKKAATSISKLIRCCNDCLAHNFACIAHMHTCIFIISIYRTVACIIYLSNVSRNQLQQAHGLVQGESTQMKER